MINDHIICQLHLIHPNMYLIVSLIKKKVLFSLPFKILHPCNKKQEEKKNLHPNISEKKPSIFLGHAHYLIFGRVCLLPLKKKIIVMLY